MNLELDAPIDKEELDRCIGKMKRGKAAGTDNMTTDWVKDLDAANRQKWVNLLNEWWVKKAWPSKMEEARVAAMYKKGDPEDPENYRPLSLLNTLSKTLAAIIKNKIEKEVEDQIGETQFGFRKGKGTTQAIYVARRIQEFAERNGLRAQFIFLDWEKAFDKISHKYLIKALESYGLPRGIIGMIKAMYQNPVFYVEVDGVRSSWKKQRKGIRQGCPLSPYLFILVMNRIFQQVHRMKDAFTRLKAGSEFQRMDVGGADVIELLFADDTLIFAKNNESMEGLLWAIEVISGVYGMKLNRGKCNEINNAAQEAPVRFEDGQAMKR